MKVSKINHRRYSHLIGACVMAISIFSCYDLEEYNPSGATAEAIWSTPEGFVTLINAAYSDQRQWYGKFDGQFMSEMGTDLWINKELDGFAKELTKYEDFTPSTGNPNKKAWQILWKPINLTNAGINRIDEAGFTSETERNQRLGELRFLRAFYYWHLVETYGGVMLRTEETKGAELTAKRSPVEDFYDLMIGDMEFAAEHLPIDWGDEYSRASKKSAMGFLARIYLSRAYYGESDTYFAKARDAANEVIQRQGELGVDLWDNYEDLWDPANNKRNKEALYVVSNSLNPALNYDGNSNRLHLWFMTAYSEKPGLQLSLEYGRDDKRRFMPTLALLDFFDEEKDARYYGSFREAWICNTDEPFVWTAELVETHDKDPSLIGTTLTPGQDTALLVTKRSIANEEMLPYVVIDRDSAYFTASNNGVNRGYDYVQLTKFEDPLTRTDPAAEPGFLDIIVMRLAEMYLIAAEAEFQLGNPGLAAGHINVLRTRAAIKSPVDYTTDMQVDADDITLDFILDERARELAGEHIRWFDLKRTGKLIERVHKYNPDITQIQDYHVLRPIPQAELDALLNGEEFGQNQGYN